MSFWSVLGDIGAGIAAPFTGGASLGLIPAINAVDTALTSPKAADVASAAGAGIGSAAEAAAQNRLTQEKLGLTAAGQNITGQTAFENELLNRAALEEQQRQAALKSVYQESAALSPRVSPYDPAGGPKLSPAYMKAIGEMSQQGQNVLAQPQKYTPTSMPALTPYTPIDIKNVEASTGQTPSTLAQVANVAGPSLSTLGTIMKLLGGGKPGVETPGPDVGSATTVPLPDFLDYPVEG